MTSDHSWHDLSAAGSAERLGTDPLHGLDEAEAGLRLDRHGPNRLPQKPPVPTWRKVLAQFNNLLSMILVAAGLLAGLIGDTTDMVVIWCVVVFNAFLGFHQEHRAERILESLKAMLAHQARIRRGGAKMEVPASDLVPGDLVLLEAGDRIPADGRLMAAHGLEVDESTLTGESQAVAKSTEALARETPLAERVNYGFMNTVVTRGRGEMVVTHTGGQTEIGRIAGLLDSTADARTPLQDRLDQLGHRLAIIAGIVVGLIMAMGLWRGEPVAEIVLTAVALAVAAIPEGLPAVVTVTLAIGMYRMARHGAIVKKLSAVETLGSTTVICSDKTGTLTVNQMTARAGWAAGRRFTVEGEGYGSEGAIMPHSPVLAHALRPAALCNDSRLAQDEAGRRVVVGDATEGALLVLAEKAGLSPDGLARTAEKPFDSTSKYMATFHREADGRTLTLVKGAPDIVLDMCSRVRAEDGERVLDEAGRAAIRGEVEHLAGQALRVLALAEGYPKDDTEGHDGPRDKVGDLTLLALVGLMDPPRPSALEAVAACRKAGIRVKMITGDHRITASAIARALGLDGEVVSGTDLDGMSDDDLAARIGNIDVFARVSPEHKVRIVRALQAGGEVTAMTGDGVNDAAALKTADIGIAMGRTGSDVTREAATMVLTDDDFSTVVRAVHEGRTIYDNIVKFVRFQLSTNIGALLTVFAAPLMGMPVPFHPIQILWVNIIMDGPPAMALAFDPSRPGLMSERPRPRQEAILTLRRLSRLLIYGITMTVGTLGILYWALQTRSVEEARTLAFTTFVLFQFFNVFNARVGTESAFSRAAFTNGKLWSALAGVIGLQVVAVHWAPAATLFHTVPLSLSDWGMATLVASSILVLDEIRKLAMRLVR